MLRGLCRALSHLPALMESCFLPALMERKLVCWEQKGRWGKCCSLRSGSGLSFVITTLWNWEAHRRSSALSLKSCPLLVHALNGLLLDLCLNAPTGGGLLPSQGSLFHWHLTLFVRKDVLNIEPKLTYLRPLVSVFTQNIVDLSSKWQPFRYLEMALTEPQMPSPQPVSSCLLYF